MNTIKVHNGFTLIELMITVAIVAVLIGLAAPSFVQTLKQNRLQMESEDFFVSLILARSEALKRNQPVAVCKSADGATCTTSDNWDQGWIIYADENADAAKQAAEPVISASEGFDSGNTLRVTGNDLDDQVVYQVDGTPSGTETFVFCDVDEDTTIAREVVISATGRPRSSKTTADCTP